MSAERVIFIHIPKAGGRTIGSIVARQYARAEIVAVEGSVGLATPFTDRDAAEARIIIGLVSFGIHERLPGASIYATMLREPISRVLSIYRYIASNPKHHLHEQVLEAGPLTFLSGDLDVEEVENGQTRQISGVIDSPDDASLDLAIRNLASFGAVGLLERFDESLMLFKRRLRWSMPFYVSKNVTPKTSESWITDEAVQVIRERNLLDIRLYAFARELFEKRVRQEGTAFVAGAAVFKTLNRLAQSYRVVRGSRVRRVRTES